MPIRFEICMQLLLYSGSFDSTPSTGLWLDVQSPAPLFHAMSKAVRRELYEGYAWFVAAYREAAEKLRAGNNRAVSFPTGSFPPPLPFVARSQRDAGTYWDLSARRSRAQEEVYLQGQISTKNRAERRFQRLVLLLSGSQMGARELRLEQNPPGGSVLETRRVPLGSLFANRVEPLWWGVFRCERR